MPRGIDDEKTLEAMAQVPRQHFVSAAMGSTAYGDHPLPIDSGQTISQPYIVALMTQTLQLKGDETILEIGTGSGYQAAVLSRICTKVYTIERIPVLLSRARRVFDALQYYNIQTKLDDGTMGWPEHGPFDAIIVTAAGPEIPTPLVDQLSESGRLIIPVGTGDVQDLQLVTKEKDQIKISHLQQVRFVELIGEHGWKN